ncbi:MULTISPECIES: TonB-dependent siderophore receptor [Aeromonas]|uniref:TonB-dependent siderophore receptor n=1 Tax=Aeromonas TaxID=642 RepID=UPI00053694DF|nr:MULTISPECIES: TonB-dependent siderophore receptor [Aeromonas]AUU21368.1 TonB-dependent siderophore receptor [Aeromonas caviae]QOK20762.1 TonB-dependent siderophore receptor [Aeromonas caviae]
MVVLKDKARSPLALAISAALAVTFAAPAGAHTPDIKPDETLVVYGNPLYGMSPSEETGGYGVDSATVGTKTPAALKDIPQSITVLTNDYIEERNFVAVDDLAKFTPGLRTLVNDSGRSSIFSRGYEYDEVNLNGLPSPMQSKYGTLPSLAAVDRVEIMRGPSGLFNSTSELGGVINMVLKRPTDAFKGSVTARYGSWDRHYLEADMGGALNDEGSLRGRVVVANADIKNQVDYNNNDNGTYYGTLEFDLSDRTRLSVYALHQTKDILPTNGLPAYKDGSLLDIGRSTYLGSAEDFFDADTTDVGASLQHAFANGGVGQVSARYMDHDMRLEQTFTNGPVDAAGNTGLMFNGQGNQQKNMAFDANYSQMFDLLGHKSEFVLGSDYKRYESDIQTYTNRNLGKINVFDFDPTRVAKPDYSYTKNDHEEQSELGLYGKVTWRLLEPLAVITGARVSWYDLDAVSTTLSSGAQSGESSAFNGKLTPYAGAVYDLSDEHAWYASYSKVFKPQTSQDESGNLLKPREGSQWETGIKSSLRDGLLNTRATLFLMKDDNIAAQAYDDQGIAITNTYWATGKVETQGVELEASGYLSQNWMVMAGYTFTDIEEKAGDHNPKFDTIPRHALSLWTDYHLADWVQGLHLGAGMTAVSDYGFNQKGVETHQGGYALFDAAVRYEINDRMQATLNLYNLLDREYFYRVGSTSTFNMYGEPANLMAGFTYKL